MRCLGLLLAAAAAAAAPLQAAAPAVSLAGTAIEIKTPDGWTLGARYAPAQEKRLTFVLLHGAGQSKEDWRPLANALQKRGYGWFAVDLRGHGVSTASPDGTPKTWKQFRATKSGNDFADMVLDVQAAVSTLVARGIAEDTIGIIGADIGSSVGLKYAAVHPKAPLIVMLSPGMSYQEVPIVNALRAYKNRPILMVYAESDRHAALAAPVLLAFAKNAAGPRNASALVAPREHGTRMLKAAVVRQIIDWIDNPLEPQVLVSTEAASMVEPALMSTSTPQSE